MRSSAENPSKEFLEYCKGKLFLVVGILRGCGNKWVVVGEDAIKIINYHKSLGVPDDAGDWQCNVNFSAPDYDSPVQVDAVIVLNKTIPPEDVMMLLDIIEEVEYKSTTSVLHTVFNHIKTSIGEEHINED